MHYKKSFFILILLIIFGGCSPDSSSSDKKSSLNLEKKVVEKDSSISKKSVGMLVILLSYNDISIQNSTQLWRERIFGNNDHELNNYYLEVSGGDFKFDEAGIVNVKLNKNHPNIDVDDSDFISKVYPDLSKALQLTDKKIDFSNYDKNGDGSISRDELIVTYIMAGFEDAYEGYHVNYGIWAHQSCMENKKNILTLDGVSLLGCNYEGNFAIFGEMHDVHNPHMATIGIIAHELGHSTFNLPDLYNTTNPSSGGIGNFGLMAGGMWGVQNDQEYPGSTPTHPCAWSKIYNGWVKPVEYKDEFVTLTQTSSREYNIAKIPIDATHYYLLENRNNSGYDKGLYTLRGNFQGGIAIWKIDETKLTKEHISLNDVNGDTNNKGVDLVEAVEGLIDSRGDGGAENALYYEGNVDYFLNYADNISARGAVMSLNIKDY